MRNDYLAKYFNGQEEFRINTCRAKQKDLTHRRVVVTLLCVFHLGHRPGARFGVCLNRVRMTCRQIGWG